MVPKEKTRKRIKPTTKRLERFQWKALRPAQNVEQPGSMENITGQQVRMEMKMILLV
mgnify:CR=1 FL=1